MYQLYFISKLKSAIFYRLNLHSGQVAHQVGAYPGFCSMKQLGVFSHIFETWPKLDCSLLFFHKSGLPRLRKWGVEYTIWT